MVKLSWQNPTGWKPESFRGSKWEASKMTTKMTEESTLWPLGPWWEMPCDLTIKFVFFSTSLHRPKLREAKRSHAWTATATDAFSLKSNVTLIQRRAECPSTFTVRTWKSYSLKLMQLAFKQLTVAPGSEIEFKTEVCSRESFSSASPCRRHV